MTDDEAFEFLAKNGWLSKTPREFRTRFFERCHIVRVGVGDSVYRLEDAPGGLWGLAHGALYLQTSVGNSSPAVTFYQHPGFWTGVASMVGRVPRKIGLTAALPSVLAYLSPVEFDRLKSEYAQTWQHITELAVANTVLSMSVTYDLMIRNPQARTAAMLLQLAGCRTVTLEAPREVLINQEGLAGIANLSRSAVSEILKGFEKARWIEIGYRKYTVFDDVSLRNLVEQT